MELRICRRRVIEIADTLSSVGLEKILEIELLDPQLEALKDLSSSCGTVTPILAYLNAIISYRLRCKGEVYWWEFAQFFKNRCASLTSIDMDINKFVNLFKEFISQSKCNKLGVNIKINRIVKVVGSINLIKDLIFSKDYIGLWRLTYSKLGGKPESKTVVFAIKMSYYGLRTLYNDVPPLPFEIPIPVDVRVAKITYSSGLVKGASSWYDLYRSPRIVINAWNSVAKRALIPPLHIDSLIWTLYEKTFRRKASRILSSNAIGKIVNELGLNLTS